MPTEKIVLVLAFLSSILLTAVFIQILRRTRIGQLFLDFPKARGLHASPVPRIGGIAIFASVWLLASLWMQRDLVAGIAALSLVLLAVSLADDLRPLSALLRLLVHAGAAILVVLFWVKTFGLAQSRPSAVIGWLMSPLGALLTVFAIIWMTNLYNFMDGADGLAGGMSLIGFGAYAIAASQFVPTSPEAASIATLCAIIAGASIGFLFFNFAPAKVFMGDAGSISLGFLAAVLGIHGVSIGLWAWWFPLLVFSPFIVDATTTLIKRIARGEKIWIAHRQHYYHQLILSGWNHRRVALSYYGVMIACGGSALLARESTFPAPLLAFWVVIYVTLIIFLERHFKLMRELKDSGQ